MATTRPSYAYNPDLPIRKWHQKWINPIISLQNAPPATHGTPAPTKEDGDFAAAGFKVRAWIPLDEDDDVTEEMLQQEVDWWTKPGAPLKPELREAQQAQRAASSVLMDVSAHQNDEAEDVVMTDAPTQPAPKTNGVMDSETTASAAEGQMDSVQSHGRASPKPVSPAPVDQEMIDAEPSPVHLTNVHSTSPSPVKPSPKSSTVTSPLATPMDVTSILPQPSNPTTAHSPDDTIPAEPTTELSAIDDILPPSKPSPSDPVAQAEEVAGGLALESPEQRAENVTDPGNLSGVGGGIAGEGIAGGRDTDLPDTEETKEEKEEEGRAEEEQKIIDASKEDMDTEIIKDPEV
jgi:hypothetical protein